MTIHHTVNSGGTSVITPTSAHHVEYVQIAGAATYREIIIDASVRSKPGLIEIQFTFPVVNGIQVLVLDAAASSGGLITSFISDGIQLSGYLRASTENTARVTPMLRVYPAL